MKNFAIIRIIVWFIIGVLSCGAFVYALSTNSVPFYGFFTHFEDVELTVKREEVVSVDVNKIEIDWIRGNINIDRSDSEEIWIVQTMAENTPDNEQMLVSVSGDSLIIKEPRRKFVFFSLGSFRKSNLDVYLPEKFYREIDIDGVSAIIQGNNLNCGKLSIDTVSGELYTSNSTFRAFEVESVSGNIAIRDCSGESLDVDAVSADISVVGDINIINMETVSGNFKLESNVVPWRFEAESVSGDVTMVVPENDGFKVNFDKVSGDFNSDFATVNTDKAYVYKNGTAVFEFNTVSGNFNIIRWDNSQVF